MAINENHVYEYIGWSNPTKVLEPDDISDVEVVLKDVTTREVIIMKGKIYMLSEPVLIINSLEGYKDVQVCLHSRGEQGRIRDEPDSNCRLWPI